MYHVDPDHKEREFLTLDELTAMTEIKLEDPNMAFARDLFIFGSWTGIAFIDIKNLTEDNISMVNGAPWIVFKRQKTGAVLALEYGMPIESVSKILGHTNITTTQIYAKVTSNKLDHDIAVFESRIKGHLPVMGGMA